MPYDPDDKDVIPYGTKVIKRDGTVVYFESLEQREVPAHVVISRRDQQFHGWSNILDITKVETEDGRIIEIGDVPIGQKIANIVKDDIPNRTKVVKTDGTIVYFKSLRPREIPAYVIISRWGQQVHGWSNIVDTTKVRREDGRTMRIGDVTIGWKITSFLPELEESRSYCKLQ